MTTRPQANRVPATDDPLGEDITIANPARVPPPLTSTVAESPDKIIHKNLQPPSHRQSSSIESVASMRSGRSWSIDTQSSVGDSSFLNSPTNTTGSTASGSNGNGNSANPTETKAFAGFGVKALAEGSASSTSKPLRRKRMSMNFDFNIPVSTMPSQLTSGLASPQEELEVPSINDAVKPDKNNMTPTSGPSSAATTAAGLPPTVTNNRQSPLRRTQSMRIKSASVSGHGPAVSASSNTMNHRPTISSVLDNINSSNSMGPTGRPRTTSHTDNYLSQLAVRERRVVDLRDELERIQQELKRAENDLHKFKQETCHALTFNTYSAAGQQSILANGDRHGRSSSLTPSHTLLHSQSHAQLNTRTKSPQRVFSNDPLDSDAQQQLLHQQQSDGRSSLQSADDVIQIGRRAIWGFGSQVKELFEDIRNVAIGEDPWQNRDQEMKPQQPASPQSNGRSSLHSQSQSQSQQSRDSQRSTTNSMYIL